MSTKQPLKSAEIANHPPTSPVEEPTATATEIPERVLAVCLGQEPSSLFGYSDFSSAARAVRQALYDGPQDVLGYLPQPVILDKNPSLADGDASLESTAVSPGEWIVNANGDLATLEEGALYLPTGCREAGCALVYSGSEPVMMDQLTVRFRLKPGLTWSDGARLTADDSLYAYQLAQAIYPRVDPELVDYTRSYQALDESTIEWRGLPGYMDPGYQANFITPLPRHAWDGLSPEDLLAADMVNQTPLSWGPYSITDWLPGEQIELVRNELYFRKEEGLPHFDRLIFRLVEPGKSAVNELLEGGCDILDESALYQAQLPELQQLADANQIKLAVAPGVAWEQLVFGLSSADGNQPRLPFFQIKEVRQAVAYCLDREKMNAELGYALASVPDSYVSDLHPLHNPENRQYSFDPQRAADLLQAAGWIDPDQDASTPRIAQGVPGVPDGTSFAVELLTSDEVDQQLAAQLVQESLVSCGIQVSVRALPAAELYAPGPEGVLFGRNFDLALFGWAQTLQPACRIYTTQEIPGAYPQHPSGWGGANLAGYSNPAFDLACQQALTSLPDQPEHQAAHYSAQAIYSEELPSIPLYVRSSLAAARADFCGLLADASADSMLWNLEAFDYGDACNQ
jgi:peptide/nickel transport system substrate-binding protein